ncbi:MAG: hypothetical protein ACQEQV_09080, partial [Fibrobacterota bacterium]
MFKKMTAAAVFLLAALLAAQEEKAQHPWELTLNSSLNLSQSYYSDNWDGNELGAISWIIDIIADADA